MSKKKENFVYDRTLRELFQDIPRGEDKVKLDDRIDEVGIKYNYEVKDIKDIDCSYLIESPNINDNILSILCNISDIDKLLSRLNKKLMSLDNKKREDYLRKLSYLLRLRPKLNEKIREIKKEELAMPFVIDKTKDPLYKEAKEEWFERGVEKGIEQGLYKGKLEGQMEEKRAIATSLLEILDDKTISQRVGLSLQEVKKLRKETF